MGDSNPRPDPSPYHPNGCDHPYREVEEEQVKLVTESGEQLKGYTFSVCQNCGYVAEQPDIFDIWHFGQLNKKYD